MWGSGLVLGGTEKPCIKRQESPWRSEVGVGPVDCVGAGESFCAETLCVCYSNSTVEWDGVLRWNQGVRRCCCFHVQLMKQIQFHLNNYSCLHRWWNSLCFAFVPATQNVLFLWLNMHSVDSDWSWYCCTASTQIVLIRKGGSQLKSLNKSPRGRKVREAEESTGDQCSDPHQTVMRLSLVRCMVDAIFRSDWQSAP